MKRKLRVSNQARWHIEPLAQTRTELQDSLLPTARDNVADLLLLPLSNGDPAASHHNSLQGFCLGSASFMNAPTAHLEEIYCCGPVCRVSIKAGAQQGLQWGWQAIRQRGCLLGHTHSSADLHQCVVVPGRGPSDHVQQGGCKAPDVNLVGCTTAGCKLLRCPAVIKSTGNGAMGSHCKHQHCRTYSGLAGISKWPINGRYICLGNQIGQANALVLTCSWVFPAWRLTTS